jgi:hypothetical protein
MIFNRTRQYIAYAADLLIILGRSVRAIKEVVTQRSSIKHWISDKQKQKKIHENKEKYNKFRAEI